MTMEMTKVDVPCVVAHHEMWLLWSLRRNGPQGKRADFGGARLACIDLDGADLRRACFSGANFSGACFSGADLRGADFSGADLTLANFSGALLWDACLEGANLARANLRGAQLPCAILRKSIIRGTDMYGADIRGADFTAADVGGEQIIDAGQDRRGDRFIAIPHADGIHIYCGRYRHFTWRQAADAFRADEEALAKLNLVSIVAQQRGWNIEA